MLKRYLKSILCNHLKSYRQMVFLVGPRQVGKTTIAKNLIPDALDGVNYFNWDILEHRKILTTQIFADKVSLTGEKRGVLVFDEIHKYPRWKNALKGLFDKYEPNTHWIITGSALLNVFRKGQDSLVGRCFNYNLAPLSVAEVLEAQLPEKGHFETLLKSDFEKPDDETQNVFERLMKYSGFPEPYLNANDEFLTKWRSSRLDKLVNQDLASTEHLRHLPLVENLMFMLPERVGSPLSLNSLREDLDVHFSTVKHWMELLGRVFYGFELRPYGKKTARMLKKEVKWYLWDWTEISDLGPRFENMVAVHLIKYINFINDTGLDNLSMYYVRDKEKHEVDFLICRNKKPEILIECKHSDTKPHRPLEYFTNKLNVRRVIQVIRDVVETQRIKQNNSALTIDIVSAASFLKGLV